MFPIYLSYGMSADDFWNGDPELVRFYRKKYYIDVEEKNFMLWLGGLYYETALATVMANSFSKNAKAKYLDRPIELLPKSAKEQEQQKIIQQQKIIAELDKWANDWNLTHKDS